MQEEQKKKDTWGITPKYTSVFLYAFTYVVGKCFAAFCSEKIWFLSLENFLFHFFFVFFVSPVFNPLHFSFKLSEVY